MQNVNERPICHRAEDLITYLYGEASEADARDFTEHLRHCDACRSEFTVFNQVHQSIAHWRNEALGVSFSPATVTEHLVAEDNLVRHERKLSAWAAVREFFSVSPVWLRTVTALAALLLCALATLVVFRAINKPTEIVKSGQPRLLTPKEVDEEVARRVNQELSKNKQAEATPKPGNANGGTNQTKPATQNPRGEMARNNVRSPRAPRVPKLSPEEREQLAMDLQLIPGREEEESLFVFSDEPK